MLDAQALRASSLSAEKQATPRVSLIFPPASVTFLPTAQAALVCLKVLSEIQSPAVVLVPNLLLISALDTFLIFAFALTSSQILFLIPDSDLVTDHFYLG